MDAGTAVHPHAGGENMAFVSEQQRRYGSPPRGWGKPSRQRSEPLRLPVHPHAGGENLREKDAAGGHIGSPPRGWGKLRRRCLAVMDRRFTPTRVGKTPPGCPDSALPAVHPHAGGENPLRMALRAMIAGSPPRGWGKLLPISRPGPGETVHPHAGGENSRRSATNSVSTVHPHAGGENSTGKKRKKPVGGSPPRGWGKRSSPK